jgi:hypothetical protein
MLSSPGSRKFLESENRTHNGWLCAPFGSPTRFRPLTATLRVYSLWGVQANLSNAHWLGAHGELTRLYISGLSLGKSERAGLHQLLPQAKKCLLERLLSPPESQWQCERLHSSNAGPPLPSWKLRPCVSRIGRMTSHSEAIYLDEKRAFRRSGRTSRLESACHAR